MDDAGDLALELGLDGNDEALAAYGDDVFLGGPVFAQAGGGAAEGGFDGAVLRLHGAADAAELGAGFVGEGAVGFDFAAQEAEERGEVVGEERLGEGADGGAEAACGFGGEDEGAPGGDTLGDGEQREDFEGVEGGAGDACLVEERGGVEEAVEVEGTAAREEGAELGGAGLLGGDPGEVCGGLKREGGGAAERADGPGGNERAETRPLEGEGARLGEGRGDLGVAGFVGGKLGHKSSLFLCRAFFGVEPGAGWMRMDGCEPGSGRVEVGAMVCSACGLEQVEGAQFCRQCGSRMVAADTGAQAWMPLTAAPGYGPGYCLGYPAAPSRVERHAQSLGISWIFYGAYRLVEFVAAVTAFHAMSSRGMFGTLPPVVETLAGTLLPVISMLAVLWSGASIAAGIGLCTRKPWARILAIVLAVPTLLKVPFGTGLGIYTLWVLAPRASGQDWDRLTGSYAAGPVSRAVNG